MRGALKFNTQKSQTWKYELDGTVIDTGFAVDADMRQVLSWAERFDAEHVGSFPIELVEDPEEPECLV